MDERRYQVFLSSTFSDLGDQRSKVMQALLRLGVFPSGMELFPAADDDSWTLIKRVIDQCDYYILIIAGRYGTVNSEGISYTELEYNYANEQNIPVLAFLHADPMSLPGSLIEDSDDGKRRLAEFRERVTERACRMWTTADGLVAELYPSFIDLRDQRPRPGWIRADKAASPEILNELAQLREENYRLRQARRDMEQSAYVNRDNLVSGNDSFVVKMTATVKNPDRTFEVKEMSVMLSWNDVLLCLGPLMFEDASESQMRSALTSLLVSSLGAYGVSLRTLVEPGELNKIKMQLLALGLIARSSKKHGVRDTETYWSLTPEGEKQLIQLAAIIKEPPPPAE